MGIRQKIWLASLVLLLAATAAAYAVFDLRLTPRFESASRALVRGSNGYVNYLLNSDLAVLEGKISSLSTWDVAYEFCADGVGGGNFVEENLNDLALLDDGYDGMIWFDEAGRAIFNRWRPSPDREEYGDVPPELFRRLAAAGLSAPADRTATITGFIVIDNFPAMLVSLPVVPHSFEAEPNGRGLTISRVRPERLVELAKLVGHSLESHVAGSCPDLAAWFEKAEGGVYLKFLGDNAYQVVNVFPALDGGPAFGLSGTAVDSIGLMSRESRDFLILSVAACLLATILLFMLYLSHAFLNPLAQMLAEVQEVQSDPDAGKMVSPRGPLEFRRLGAAVNDMIESMRAKGAELVAANEATRAKGDFLASMSHELRTPLNGVLATADLLLESDLSDEQREYAETIVNSGGTLLTIINDILDFSRMEAGKLRLENVEFDLEAAIDGVVRLLAPAAESKGLELAFDYPPHVPRLVMGDPGRLRQVITNLVGNAVKFTMSGHVLVEVNRPIGGKDFVIVVRDSGIGISESAQSRLFGRYEQAETDTARRFGGSGLGLMISKQLVEMMGGSIWLESRLGVGSNFFFKAPLALTGQPRAALNSDALPLGGQVLVAVSGLSGRILAKQMEECGLKAAHASNVPGVLELLKGADSENPYALLLFERGLEGGGIEALLDGSAALGLDPFALAWRSLLLVSIGDRKARDRAKRKGFNAIMAKPASLPRIIDTLEHLPGQPAAAGNGQAAESPPPPRARALVVDDNPLNRQVTRRMLEKLGCVVDNAESGQAAVAASEGTNYDIIFMDCQMPGMDGYEASRAIRQRENGASEDERLFIVAMTGHAGEADKALSLAAGMDEHLVKPFSLAALKELLERRAKPAPDQN